MLKHLLILEKENILNSKWKLYIPYYKNKLRIIQWEINMVELSEFIRKQINGK